MKCPQCQSEGKKSKVYCRGGTSTLLGGPTHYYDEDGNPQNCDSNYHTYHYYCSNGHDFFTTSQYGKTWVGGRYTQEDYRVYVDE
jgi:hypothetical protein